MDSIYLSHSLDEDTPSYGNRDEIQILPKSEICKGSTANSSTWRFSINHIGTHIDVPRHFYDSGCTITDMEANDWIFNHVTLLDIPCNNPELLTIDRLKEYHIDPKTDLLLVRTGYEEFRTEDKYWNAYPGIQADACEWLRKSFKKLRGIGFDFISLTSPQFKDEGKKAHQIMLDDSTGKFILIIEDMKLAHLQREPSLVIVSPLLVKQANGSPVTVFGFNGDND